MQVEKLLIRGPNWLGDCVLAIPAMKAIRAQYPDARITLLVRPWVAGLFTGAEFIDAVWSEPKPAGIAEWKRLRRRIREGRFDAGLLFPNSFESALMMFLARVPVRRGYATDGRRFLLTHPIVPPRGEARHQVYYYLDLVPGLAVTRDQPSIEIRATDQERVEARRLLASEGIAPGQPYIVLNPGAAYGSAKRWSEEQFAQAGDQFAMMAGFKIAMIGSKNERTAAEKIQSRMKSPAAVLSGKTSIETLIGVLSEASLIITNDSGPMHIAAALGTPTVAVFGSTDDRVTGPVGRKTRIVKHPVECSPCLLRECPIDHRCMTRVTVRDVCRAAEELLSHA